MVSTTQLIELVHQRPVIWDRTCKDYRERLNRVEAWNEICKAVLPNFKDIKSNAKSIMQAKVMKKWYNIRDSYVKSMRYRGTRKSGKPYLYADMLSFLDRVTVEKNEEPDGVYVEYEQLEKDFDNDKVSEPDSEPYINEIYIDQSMDEETTPAKLAKRDIAKPQENLDESNNMFLALSTMIEREEDEDRAFFNSITPTVKSLSRDVKMDFRIEVLKLLKRLKPVKHEIDPII